MHVMLSAVSMDTSSSLLPSFGGGGCGLLAGGYGAYRVGVVCVELGAVREVGVRGAVWGDAVGTCSTLMVERGGVWGGDTGSTGSTLAVGPGVV